MKVFLSGPITSRKETYKRDFMFAQLDLTAKGHTVLNPSTLPQELSEAELMDICLAMLRSCDAIYLLCGHEKSDGSATELAYAKKLGLEIIEQV